MTPKKVLLINGFSSSVTGILLTVTPNFFANLFKINETAWFVEVGIFLLLFSVFVLLTAFKNPIRKSWIKLIIGIDVTWVIVSVIATTVLISTISGIGSVIILAIAGWVSLMAYLQNKTLKNV